MQQACELFDRSIGGQPQESIRQYYKKHNKLHQQQKDNGRNAVPFIVSISSNLIHFNKT